MQTGPPGLAGRLQRNLAVLPAGNHAPHLEGSGNRWRSDDGPETAECLRRSYDIRSCTAGCAPEPAVLPGGLDGRQGGCRVVALNRTRRASAFEDNKIRVLSDDVTN